mmetsp:Transcript_89039/g.229737  ORF Transcript_89039/g.229737 Transcript_89039/m.229737 type:complete len:207 (+) Transcript_89039:66-686(+)
MLLGRSSNENILRLFSHHDHELVEADVPIAISVDLFHQIVDVLTHDLAQVAIGQHGLKFVARDAAIIILVEDAECTPTNVLVNVLATLESRREEFCVIDLTAAIGVDGLDDAPQLQGQLDALLLKSTYYLFHREGPVTVRVHLHENITQFFDELLIELSGHCMERCFVQLVLHAEAFQIAYDLRLHIGLSGSWRRVLGPRVLQRFT